MKGLLLTLSILVSFNAQANSLGDFTSKIVQAKQDMIACDTAKTCTTASFGYNTLMAHPNNVKNLDKCMTDSKCYEASMDITMYILTDFLTKMGEL